MAYLLRRIGWMVLTLWVVYTVSFFLMRAVPGGPLSGDRKLPPEVMRNIEKRYKLDQPVWQQYLTHLSHAACGDFGPSFRLADFTVNEIIAQGFPVSASLGILALTFALGLGLTAGIVSALRRGMPADFTLMGLATIGIALPNFVIAGLGILLLVFTFRVFPAAGWGTAWQVVLPALCLGLPYAAYIARLTRSGMLDVLGQDYIRTARAKGLAPVTVVLRHALPGAVLPVVSFLGPASAGILTGSLVLEQIFALPGLGLHFIHSATQRDYTLTMGTVMLYTLMLCVMNLLVDLSYGLIDPRVKLE